MKKIVFLIALLAVVVVGSYGYYSQVYLPNQVTPEPSYSTTKVRTGDISITTSGVGYVIPAEKVTIGFQVNGILDELNVKIGDPVEAGQVLAKLDDTDAQLNQFKAELALNTFFSRDSIQKAEFDRLEAKAVLDDAEGLLKYLISPQVYYWESAVEEAQAEFDRLKAENASEDDLQAAQKAIEKAQGYLKTARNEFYETYVWEVFPYSYTDEVTYETIDTYTEPNPDTVMSARLQVESAELALKNAEDFLATLKAGMNTEIINAAAYSGTNQADLDEARVELETAQIAMERTVLTAPISGIVTGINANSGQAITSTPFLTIETLDQMTLHFYVEESDITLVKIGNPVLITFAAYSDQPVEGQITYLEPAIQTVDGSPAAVVWADLPGDMSFELLSGMSADVEVIAGEAENALLVPVQALRELGPDSYAVFVVQSDGTLKMTPVTVGLKDYANAQILSGLKAGDVISTGTVETK
jgi:RND family efflux transporter MFP subunit